MVPPYAPQPGTAHLRVDLSSDTATRPTAAMRRVMADAPVGDEQKGEDPSVNDLVERVSALLGQEAAVLLPSGTMCNQIALAVHCRPGDAYYCHRSAHPIGSEAGGGAAIAGAQPVPIDSDRGIFTGGQLEVAILPSTRYSPRPRLAWVEQTANLVGGCVWSLDQLAAVHEVAGRHDLATHLDGARLLNASVATGATPAEQARRFDTAWIDLSKGLGAPVGAVLGGSAAVIDEAWRWKQRLGGAMRQAGILAAAALHALDHHVDRLAEDHARARTLARGLAEVPGLAVDPERVETNIVLVDASAWPGGASAFVRDLAEGYGVRASFGAGGTVRFVTHLDVDDGGIEVALDAARRLSRAVTPRPGP